MIEGFLGLVDKGIQTVVTMIMTTMCNCLRTLLTAVMVQVFKLFDVEGAAGFGTGDTAVSLSSNGAEKFMELFGAPSFGPEGLIGNAVSYVILPVSTAIAVMLLSWSLYKSIVSDNAKESPGKTVTRGVFAVFFVFAMYPMLGVARGIAQGAEGYVFGRLAKPVGSLDVGIIGSFLDNFGAVFDVLTGEYSGYYAVFMNLIALFFPINLTFRYFKVVMSYFFRFIRLELLRVFSPLSGAAYASGSTEDIFKAYLRLYVSSLISVVASYAMILTARAACIATMKSSNLASIFIMFIMTRGVFDVIDNLDNYLSRFKLNNVPNHAPTMLDTLAMEFSKVAGRALTTEIPNAAMGFAGHHVFASTPPAGGNPSSSERLGGLLQKQEANGANGTGGPKLTKAGFNAAVAKETRALKETKTARIRAEKASGKSVVVVPLGKGEWAVRKGEEPGKTQLAYKASSLSEAMKYVTQKGYSSHFHVYNEYGDSADVDKDPNAAHLVINEVEKMSKMTGFLVAQNTDNPSEYVNTKFQIRIDGTVHTVTDKAAGGTYVKDYKSIKAAVNETKATMVFFNESDRMVSHQDGAADMDKDTKMDVVKSKPLRGWENNIPKDEGVKANVLKSVRHRYEITKDGIFKRR